VRKYNQSTTDISSTIATDRYLPVNRYSNEGVLTIGWSGSHSTSVYLKLLGDVLRKLKQRQHFRLLVIGDAKFQLEGIEVEALPWTESSEVRDLQRIDIGLYPLPNEEWVYGKSGLKALQYMALGIPTIATAIGANFRVIEDGKSGFLVKSEEEWLERLEQLMKDANLRRAIGAKARERVESLYSVKANEPVYLKIFQSTFL
jgi:glycosyltransferase involved in cell wall biosynthesis